MRDFDPVEILTDDETIAAYLKNASEQSEGDQEFYNRRFAECVKTKMINEMAAQFKIDRQELFELLSPESITPPTIIAKFTMALGMPTSQFTTRGV
jgi:probable addiction module antidote protein